MFLLLLLVAFAGLGAGVTAPELEKVKTLTAQARLECESGRTAVERSKRQAHFEQGQRLAEQAVALDERYADAHFALFCNLGEMVRLDGESLSSLVGYRRMRQELDRALELDPEHLDAMSAKGTFLVRLPVLFGGNPEEGERLLRNVIQRDPEAVNARLSLARSVSARGNYTEAMSLATEALSFARSGNRLDFIPEAETIIEAVRAKLADH
jgi:tetratricopeptide (TPR) repeat protein